MITDGTIEYISILAKIELSAEEKIQAKQDMGRILEYIDKMKELDTEGVEAMTHTVWKNNVFREDIVRNGDDREAILSNAPSVFKGAFKVPKTVE